MSNLKYNYLKVIQQNYGNGWEDNSEYQTDSTGHPLEMSGKFRGKYNNIPVSLLSADLIEYRLTGYQTRVIFRKELKETTV
jgi:hypothetical protein